MKKIALIALAALSWSSCKQSTGFENTALSSATSVASIDSLNTAFYDAWNKKDSAAVLSLLTDDVIMVSAQGISKGKEAVAKNFVSRQMPVANNLKGMKESGEASKDLGYLAGTWSLTVTVPDKAPSESTGNYTFISKRGDDGKWKFSVLNIQNYPSEK